MQSLNILAQQYENPQRSLKEEEILREAVATWEEHPDETLQWLLDELRQEKISPLITYMVTHSEQRFSSKVLGYALLDSALKFGQVGSPYQHGNSNFYGAAASQLERSEYWLYLLQRIDTSGPLELQRLMAHNDKGQPPGHSSYPETLGLILFRVHQRFLETQSLEIEQAISKSVVFDPEICPSAFEKASKHPDSEVQRNFRLGQEMPEGLRSHWKVHLGGSWSRKLDPHKLTEVDGMWLERAASHPRLSVFVSELLQRDQEFLPRAESFEAFRDVYLKSRQGAVWPVEGYMPWQWDRGNWARFLARNFSADLVLPVLFSEPSTWLDFPAEAECVWSVKWSVAKLSKLLKASGMSGLYCYESTENGLVWNALVGKMWIGEPTRWRTFCTESV